MSDSAKSRQRTLEALSESQMYRDYAEAFTRGTGLPLSLHAPEIMHVVQHSRKQENPFCALMAKTNQSCAGCYALQCKLEKEANLEPLKPISMLINKHVDRRRENVDSMPLAKRSDESRDQGIGRSIQDDALFPAIVTY